MDINVSKNIINTHVLMCECISRKRLFECTPTQFCTLLDFHFRKHGPHLKWKSNIVIFWLFVFLCFGIRYGYKNIHIKIKNYYDDVIMTMLASQITSLMVVYSIVYSGVNQRKHQSSASLAFVREIHRGPGNFPHKWLVTRKMFLFDDVIMEWASRLIHKQTPRVGWEWDEETSSCLIGIYKSV